MAPQGGGFYHTLWQRALAFPPPSARRQRQAEIGTDLAHVAE